jgi:hypothetical protein
VKLVGHGRKLCEKYSGRKLPDKYSGRTPGLVPY